MTQKSHILDLSRRWFIEIMFSRLRMNEHSAEFYLITQNSYNENISNQNIQSWLNIQRYDKPKWCVERNQLFIKYKLMSMTIDNQNNIPNFKFRLYLMRICESSIVWWKSQRMNSDLLLIYFTDYQKCWKFKRIHHFCVFMSSIIIK